MAKIQLIYNTDDDVPEQGYMFLHCAKCLREKADGVSPKKWAQQQCSATAHGFQVWCIRHDCNIALVEVKLKEEGDG